MKHVSFRFGRRPDLGGQGGPVTELQDAEEVYEVLFLFVREPNLEAAIEEVHQFGQIPGGTVGEVGRVGGESAELLHQDGADIRASSGDECTAGVLSQKGPAQLRVRRG